MCTGACRSQQYQIPLAEVVGSYELSDMDVGN